MTRDLFLAALLAGLVAQGGPAAGQADSSSGEVLVQVEKLTPGIVSYVAKVGQEQRVSVDANTDILKLIARYCGSANARRSYVGLFAAANAENADIKKARLVTTAPAEFVLPGCIFAEEAVAEVGVSRTGPKWSKPRLVGSSSAMSGPPVRVPRVGVNHVQLNKMVAYGGVPKSLTGFGAGVVKSVDKARLQDPALIAMLTKTIQLGRDNPGFYSGKPSPKFQKAFKRVSKDLESTFVAQDILAANKNPDFTSLQVGGTLTVPTFEPKTYTFTVAAGYNPAEVAKAVGGASISNAIPYLAAPQSESGQHCSGPGDRPWPFDITELQRVLTLRGLINKHVRSSQTLIFDTGFPGKHVGTIPFKPFYFIPRKVSGDQSRPVWNATRSETEFYGNLALGSHGIGVLTMALGGVQALKGDVLTGSSVAISDGFIISMMGYIERNGRLVLERSAVSRTLSGHTWSGAHPNVINLSLRLVSGDSSQTALLNHITSFQNRNRLYVFAAGNADGDAEPLNLDTNKILPAAFGGQTANVITVASVNPDDTLSGFSYYGKKRVDIAAPGCQVPVFAWDNAAQKFTETRMSGTSISAPLVSFVANLLTRDFISDVSLRKARILSSGRFLPSLVGKVSSQRTVDIPTALALHFDVVRRMDGTIDYGYINWPQSGKIVCGDHWRRDHLAQVHFEDDDIHLAFLDVGANGSTVEVTDCKRKPQWLRNLSFRKASADGGSLTWHAPENLNISEIKSITLCGLQACEDPAAN